MNLVIDIGNTNIKIGFFSGKEIQKLWSGFEIDEMHLREWVEPSHPKAAIISTVRTSEAKGIKSEELQGEKMLQTFAPDLQWLSDYNIPVLLAGPHLKLPIRTKYQTPETLGSDRLAAAVAAADRFEGENTLVINAGSCITTDFVSDAGEYLGGTIAPGLHMRLRAMHHFTGRLPLIHNVVENTPILGDTTESSMMSGVINGITAEIEGMIAALNKEIGFFNIILSGGDGKIFAKKLKSRIFAVDNIVLHGLNLMLKHNA